MKKKKQNNKVNTRKAILMRSYVVFGVAFLFALWIMVSSARLQMGIDNEFGELLKKKNTRISDIKAMRGNIYAEGERLLATTTSKYTLIVDAVADGLTDEMFDKNIQSLSIKMAQHFKKRDTGEWLSYFKMLRANKRRYTILAKGINYGLAKKMREWPIIGLGRYKGFYFEEYGERLYFMGEMARKAIGSSKGGVYVGLEGALDSLLSGINGKQMQQRMPGGVWRTIKTAKYNQPRDGYDIITTLDVQIQDVAQYALQKAVRLNKAQSGCAIVMDVKTGAVKAIANLKRGTDGKYRETKNYAVDDYSEPGSTVKLISAMALINDGYCKPLDSIDIQWGKYKFYDKTMLDASRPKKTVLTLHESFQYSSNVGISRLVSNYYKKRPKKFIAYFKKLRLDQTPAFDIKSASFPIVQQPGKGTWSANSLPWLSIGYEAKLSPLQILTVYNAVANNGTLMRPYMVSELRQQGRVVDKIQPIVLEKKICKASTIESLQKMMESVISDGTGKNLESKSYAIAGKTGTAQIANGNKGYKPGAYKASFAGYFPADNPKYSIIVVINEPKAGQYYGGRVAGPVFKEISDFIYSKNNAMQKAPVTPEDMEFPQIMKGPSNQVKYVLDHLAISSYTIGKTGAYTEAKGGKFSVELHKYDLDRSKIPNLKNMGLRDATYILESMGLKVSYEGTGKVMSQSIKAGSRFRNGQTIKLLLK